MITSMDLCQAESLYTEHHTLYDWARVVATVGKNMSVCVSVCVCVSCSLISDSVTPWTIANQIPLSMEFSGQEYWNGLLCPPPGDLPDPGIKVGSHT